MQETNRTEIATLGEFGLIKRLTENIQIQNPESKYGIGDDAAVFVQDQLVGEAVGQHILVVVHIIICKDDGFSCSHR